MRVPLLIAIVLAGLAAVVPAALATASGPVVRITDMAPLRISGSGFRAHESLHLRVALSGGAIKRHIVASRRGTFAVSFGAVSEDPCTGGGMIVVVRADGTEVVRKVFARACPMPAPVSP